MECDMIERRIPERESALIVHALVFARKYISACACTDWL